MEALVPIVVGGAVVLAVAVVVRLGLRRSVRAGRRDAVASRKLASDILIGTSGAVAMIASVVAGRELLSIDEPPRREQFRTGVGFAASDAARPNPDRGSFVIGLAARFTKCDEPVDVTIAIAGTAEYFEDNRAALAATRTFTIAVPNRGLRSQVAVAYGDRGYEDALKPPLARRAPSPIASLETLPPVEHQGADVTSVAVRIPRWSSHLSSLVVQFEADWLVDRGRGTCYLVLPPLVGLYSVLAAQAGLNKARDTDARLTEIQPQVGEPVVNDSNTVHAFYDRTLSLRNGVAVVDAGSGEATRFEPEANTVAAGFPGIACSQEPLETGELGTPGAATAAFVRSGDPSAFAIREGTFAQQVGGLDCSATVTMAEADASRQRDLVLLLIGAFLSLGAAVLLEVVLDATRRRLTRHAA